MQASLLELPHQYQRFSVSLPQSQGKDDLKYHRDGRAVLLVQNLWHQALQILSLLGTVAALTPKQC